ncbi:TIGR04283 family arsenosugar biosynthesis glycosyltransferase [Aestuariirhabdus litorea]|uniref:Glycosyltransferase n=1 Tax=Aestuariirhabdus litorea TaxID=2528527 RepID=A0A3P3VQF6_9GAMM|nr:TIGR04283 family arsenosugar biosynthesis glycosyltransferase [Aestuariirhabdus litorea]RRJ85021.1 glycosyltransferase [Aestuariirhabdus litorea]RWW98246.1 glycosyltransferase [Endozoicomonadaceae bacterium GTF-13]
MRISVIIPALNEALSIAASLNALQPLRARGHEVILVDGGSHDETPSLAEDLVDRLLYAESGRAKQMMAGAAAAEGDLLLFLHADTRLPDAADRLLGEACEKGDWGRFDLRLSGGHWLFPIIAWFINKRSRLTGIATGDQAIFVRPSLFWSAGGFADIPLMEDIEISRRLKKRGAPVCINTPLVTSSRRWESRGVFRTVALMWKLRFLYFLGVSPEILADQYRRQE